MRKIKGSDIFALACRSSIGIVSYEKGAFQMLNFIDSVYQNVIFEIAIFGNYMIPVSIGSQENIKVFEFGSNQFKSMKNSNEYNPKALKNQPML